MAECDRYGFFNGIYGLEQSNWANYWRGIIPDGVIANQGDEMEVYGDATKMTVHVKTGQAMVDNHRVWITSEKDVELAAGTGSARTDTIVIRITYGNSGESKAEVIAKTGSTSLTKNTGGIYELELARVAVPAADSPITTAMITDRRYVFKPTLDSATAFSGTSVTPLNDREYRNGSAIASLTINLPANPNATFITGVNFTASASFSGISFKKGTANLTPRLIGDAITMKSKRYNLIIWWDGSYYWAAVKAVATS